ncbi:aspartate/glutamate racemase family protein [candidate division KSB1 bacterium]|nr:aspartate/glutamate racemase family protein [candidate division KSB1 bacterium]
MKTIGLVGGTGWISSVDYYRIINLEINKRLGGLTFAKCILYSVNYGEIDDLNKRNDLDGVYSIILDAAEKLVGIGADCILLCANTLHMFADRLEHQIPVPLIHIAEATAKHVRARGLTKVGLLGSRDTMEKDFYKAKLNKENIQVIVPEKDDREFIHNTILNEILKEILSKTSRARFLDIISKLQEQGAEGIVLGCTEIPLLIKQSDVEIPVFNTTVIHSLAAVDFALGETE